MSERPPEISKNLRDWIIKVTRSGQDVPGLLQQMKDAGYEARQSRRIVAKVLNNPAIAMDLSLSSPQSRKLRHPQPPGMDIDDRHIRVTSCIETPKLRVLDSILSDEECDQLIEEARPRMERAKTLDAEGRHQIDEYRTSDGMFFNLGETELVARIEHRLATLLDMPVSHGESLQILNYRVGQEYQPHFDWFSPQQDGFKKVTSRGGQRIASVIMYLNTPPGGGGTHFPEADFTVTALRGSAVYFAYQSGDRSSLHAGLPVTAGEKWIATKWLRERPYC